MRTILLLAALTALLAVPITACDSSDGGGDSDTDTDTDSDTDTDTDSDTDTDADTDTCDLGVYDGGVNIYDTDDIEELKGYTAVSGGLDVSGDELTDLTGLECLTEVDMLFISHCGSLASLTGLDALTTVGSNAEITDDAVLEDLTGLGSLTAVGGAFDLGSLPLVTDLTGLENLETASLLRISSMDGLSDISGLDGLTTLGPEGMRILWCDELTSLGGLDSLTQIDGDLAAIGNTQLPFCEVCTLLEQLDEPPTTVTVSGNLDDECGAGDAGILDCGEPDGGPDAG